MDQRIRALERALANGDRAAGTRLRDLLLSLGRLDQRKHPFGPPCPSCTYVYLTGFRAWRARSLCNRGKHVTGFYFGWRSRQEGLYDTAAWAPAGNEQARQRTQRLSVFQNFRAFSGINSQNEGNEPGAANQGAASTNRPRPGRSPRRGPR